MAANRSAIAVVLTSCVLVILVVSTSGRTLSSEGQSGLGNSQAKEQESNPGPLAEGKNGGCGDARLDLVFVLDSSTSVTETNFDRMKDFVKTFVKDASNNVDEGNFRVGVVVAYGGTRRRVMFHLNEFATNAGLLNAIDAISYRPGNSNMADSLRAVSEEMFTEVKGDRPDVDNVAIVVKDAVSNKIDSRRTVPEAERARSNNVHVYAVDVGLPDSPELDGVASRPVDENRFAVRDYSGLKSLSDDLFSSMCSSPQAVANPLPATQDGGSRLLSIIKRSIRRKRTPSPMESLKDTYKYFHRDLAIFLSGYKARLQDAYQTSALEHVEVILRLFPTDSRAFSSGNVDEIKTWINRTLEFTEYVKNNGAQYLREDPQNWFGSQKIQMNVLDFMLKSALRRLDIAGTSGQIEEVGSIGGQNVSGSHGLSGSDWQKLTDIARMLSSG